MNGPARRSLAPVWFRVGLIMGGLVAGMVLTEALLRLAPSIGSDGALRERRASDTAKFFDYDDVLGWKGKPYAEGVSLETGVPVSVRLNARGVRERDVPVEKPNGRVRILILGDSQTWGLGVEQGQRYSEVLDGLLRQGGFQAEVLNFGVNGYGTDQAYLLFKQAGAEYRPDLVVLGFYWNDLFENAHPTAWGYPKPQFVQSVDGSLELRNVPVPARAMREGEGSFVGLPQAADESGGAGRGSVKRWLEDHSRAFRLLASAFRQNPLLYRLAVESGLAGGPRRDSESTEWQITKRLLVMLNKAVHETGAELLVLVIPERSDLEMATYPFRRPLIEDLCALNCLDVFPALKAAGPADTLFDHTGHLRVKGHAVIGQSIFTYLMQNQKSMRK